MGLFDTPSLILDPIYAVLNSWLPSWLQILLWALLAAILSMWVYARLSDQAALSQLRPIQKDARNRLAVYDGPFDGLMPLIRVNLALSGRHIRLTLIPALVATLPLLLLLPWLSNTYGAHFPPAGTPVAVHLETKVADTELAWLPPATIESAGPGQWNIAWPGADTQVQLTSGDSTVLLTLPMDWPSVVLHKHQWWNYLIVNPAGYLDAESPIDSVVLELPKQEITPFGPDWLRGWLPTFMVGLLVFSLLIKWHWRLR